MKKMLFSVLAGLVVVGAAWAVPTPDDRRALCEKYPDKYVWVEKTQACVPFNPCISNNPEFYSYCKRLWVVDDDALNLVVDRYVKQVLKDQIASPTVAVSMGEHHTTIFVKTKGGDYFVVEADVEDQQSEDGVVASAIHSAFWAYGCNSFKWGPNKSEDPVIVEGICNSIISGDATCADVKDFASLMSGVLLEQDTSAEKCTLKYHE